MKSPVQGVDGTKRANVGDCLVVVAGGGPGVMRHRKKDNKRRENEQKRRVNAPSLGTPPY